MNNALLVGIDVGGTFTDFVVWRDERLHVHKVPTTPEDQSIAIVQGLRELGLLTGDAPAPSPALAIVHGMTVATNALLERRGYRFCVYDVRTNTLRRRDWRNPRSRRLLAVRDVEEVTSRIREERPVAD